MRIAQVAPLNESVPPPRFGGTGRIVSYLTESLVGLGHDVTLFASGDSDTRARLVPACPRALCREPDARDTSPHHVRLMELVFEEAESFDVIHFHCGSLHFPLLPRHRCTSVTTLYGIGSNDVQALLNEHRDVAVVSISNSQRSAMPHANWQGTVYHGLPRDSFLFRGERGRYLAYLGRISPEKRIDRAIAIAQRAGIPLKIAAKIYPEDQPYFDETLAPLLRTAGPLVEFMGEIDYLGRNELLGHAAALLLPVDCPEPFGLVMIEALACGTPVIAWRRGSIPEIVEDGMTGHIVESVDEAVEVAKTIHRLSRDRCRQAFEQRFDADRMAADYVKIYRRVIASARRQRLCGGRRPARPLISE
jgi:glycosyltransferase involved in cell wall biosynthesis